MAKFVEVMKQARRICLKHPGDCDGCPLHDDDGLVCRFSLGEKYLSYDTAERIVLKWAEEHPEPMYPSWEEAWKKLFPEADVKRAFCPEVFGDKYKCDWCFDDDDNDNCDECLERPIPAEIAEKLGIRPKEE